MRHRLHHTRVDELESIDTRTTREVQDGPRTDEESYHHEKGSSTDVAEGEDEMRVQGQLPRRIEERHSPSTGDRPASSAGDGSRRAVEAWPRRPAWEVDREGGVPDQHVRHTTSWCGRSMEPSNTTSLPWWQQAHG